MALLLRVKVLGSVREVTLLSPVTGFVFSFRRSEKLGTDCASGFSGWVLRLMELEFLALAEGLGIGAADVLGVEDDKLLLDISLLELVEDSLLDKVSLQDLSWP